MVYINADCLDLNRQTVRTRDRDGYGCFSSVKRHCRGAPTKNGGLLQPKYPEVSGSIPVRTMAHGVPCKSVLCNQPKSVLSITVFACNKNVIIPTQHTEYL